MKIFRTWTFTWWEVGLLKVCLISVGILLAIYFRSYLVDLTTLWWTLFVLTTLYFLVKMFRES